MNRDRDGREKPPVDKRLGCWIPLGAVLILLAVVAVCSALAGGSYEPRSSPVPLTLSLDGNRPAAPPSATSRPRPTATQAIDQELVANCKTTWEYILYVAEGYEIDGYEPNTAQQIAISGVSELYGISLGALEDCLAVLELAGYDASQLQPKP